jgi:hypothetical protein
MQAGQIKDVQVQESLRIIDEGLATIRTDRQSHVVFQQAVGLLKSAYAEAMKTIAEQQGRIVEMERENALLAARTKKESQ